MSASRRHGNGDDNILARLEREGKRGPPGKTWKRMNTTVAWCGAATLAVFGLVVVLASLARENSSIHSQPTMVEAKAPYDRHADLEGKNGFAPLPAVGSPPRKKAAVVADEAVARPMLPSVEAAHAPPMVMLKPTASAAFRTGAPMKGAAVATSKPADAAKPAAALVAKPATARSSPVRPAAKHASPKSAPVKVAATPPRPLAVAPVRPKKVLKAPAAVKPEAAPVDSDVALLSAIIMHSSRHAAERAQLEAQACATGRRCAAPKTTD